MTENRELSTLLFYNQMTRAELDASSKPRFDKQALLHSARAIATRYGIRESDTPRFAQCIRIAYTQQSPFDSIVSTFFGE